MCFISTWALCSSTHTFFLLQMKHHSALAHQSPHDFWCSCISTSSGELFHFNSIVGWYCHIENCFLDLHLYSKLSKWFSLYKDLPPSLVLSISHILGNPLLWADKWIKICTWSFVCPRGEVLQWSMFDKISRSPELECYQVEKNAGRKPRVEGSL